MKHLTEQNLNRTANFVFGFSAMLPVPPLILVGFAGSWLTGGLRTKPTLAGMFTAASLVASAVAIGDIRADVPADAAGPQKTVADGITPQPR
ncbi:MAG: hypothetical protein H5T99_05670 [Moorella sp. (in: Bacteria)]|nr:hypothetical protein [Moorella sp. (in: firmicutes)]